MSNDNKMALNTILYGPPGTGKTYSVVDKCLEIIDKQAYQGIIHNPDRRSEAMDAFKKLRENHRIEFCTFHQSYGYEEFVEGWRCDGNGGFEVQPGIFKKICKDADSKRICKDTDFSVYKMPLGRDEDIYDYCIEKNVIAIWGGGQQVDYSKCYSKELIEIEYYTNPKNKSKKGEESSIDEIETINCFKNKMNIGDVILIGYNGVLKGIAKIVGDYEKNHDNGNIAFKHFRKVEWLFANDDKGKMIPLDKMFKKKKPEEKGWIDKVDKIDFEFFKEYITSNYVLIIDEINRGNISKIFGELITLIEPDKRLGEENEITVQLPYSGSRLFSVPFGVPSNLYIIGTMNTADRSISQIDTALRRRFNFIEMLPQPELLKVLYKKEDNEKKDGIDVRKLLKTINERIEYLYDRDHVIGHGYFMEAKSTDNLLEIMREKIIPLLQEYFYDQWEKIEKILGGATEIENNKPELFT